MRVTSKGQVTIPKSIREKLGIKPGDEVEFLDQGQTVSVIKSDEEKGPNRRLIRFESALEKWRGKGKSGMTTQEFMRAVRPSDISGSLGYVKDAVDVD
ncbi:MAG: AbrB/MazE/SpoVT family DNA-binding domain-containing protein [Pseudomonadota bacterium]